MLILNDENNILNTDEIEKSCYFSVLSFKDYKNPDFFFDHLNSHIEYFESASVVLEIGPYSIVMPLPWSILCTDYENVESIPLYEICGREYQVFTINPISGYMPRYYPLKLGTIYKNTTWTCPTVNDKDMLVVPLGRERMKEDQQVDRGPVCAIFSPSKMEINKQISDIW
jgi:hypothetical protein